MSGTAEQAGSAAEEWIARAAAIAPRTEAFIDGRFVPAASGETFADIDRPRRSTIAQVASGGAEDVDRAVAAARASFDDRRWADRSPADRKRVLLRFAERIREQRDELALLESLDVGKPIRDTLAVDVPSAAKTIQWYAETIDKTYGEVGPTGPDALSLVTREPIGVVAAIVPWNYPLIITAWKIGAALATGNSVVLKPASQSPLTALRLAELAVEAGLPDGVLNVVPGPGAVVGPALARHPGVDKITFTGSTEVGKSLLRAVGESRRQGDHARARREEPAGRPRRRRRPRGGRLVDRLGDLLQQRPDLQRGLAARRPSLGPRGARRADRGPRAGQLAPAEPLDPATRLGAIVDERQLEKVLGLRGARAGGGRACRGRRRAGPRGERRLLRPADDPRRRRRTTGASRARRSSGRS